MFFQGFGPPEGTPRRRWDRPRATLVLPSGPGAPEPLKMDPGRSILNGFGAPGHSKLRLKTAFSRETSFKNYCRGTALFAYLIFSKILKIELSPTRELNFRCFENWFSRIFREPKIRRIAVLPA